MLQSAHEMLGNAVKHGMRLRLFGHVPVLLHATAADSIELSVSDDGWEPVAAPAGVGGFIMADLAAQHGGSSRGLLVAARGGYDAEHLSRRHGRFTAVVTQQTTLLADQETALAVQEQRMVASVTLVQALGGAWSTQDMPSREALQKGLPFMKYEIAARETIDSLTSRGCSSQEGSPRASPLADSDARLPLDGVTNRLETLPCTINQR